MLEPPLSAAFDKGTIRIAILQFTIVAFYAASIVLTLIHEPDKSVAITTVAAAVHFSLGTLLIWRKRIARRRVRERLIDATLLNEPVRLHTRLDMPGYGNTSVVIGDFEDNERYSCIWGLDWPMPFDQYRKLDPSGRFYELTGIEALEGIEEIWSHERSWLPTKGWKK